MNYITSAQALAEETPISWKYTPNDELTIPRTPQWKMGKPSPKKKTPPKAKVGPGLYHDGLAAGHRQTTNSTRCYSASRAKKESAVTAEARRAAKVPGVGSYQNMDAAYKNVVFRRARATTFLPSKFVRFADEHTKSKQWVPGPGSYNIGPPAKRI